MPKGSIKKGKKIPGLFIFLPTTKSTAIFKWAPPSSGAVRDLWYESNVFKVDNKEKEGSLRPLQGRELAESFK